MFLLLANSIISLSHFLAGQEEDGKGVIACNTIEDRNSNRANIPGWPTRSKADSGIHIRINRQLVPPSLQKPKSSESLCQHFLNK